MVEALSGKRSVPKQYWMQAQENFEISTASQEGVETLGSQVDGVTFRHDSPSASRAERGRARRLVRPDSTCHASERR